MDRIAKLEAMLADQPGDSFLQHALALEQIKKGNESAARRLFETILAADPTYIGSYYHLAKLLERTGCTDEAIAVYEQGMKAARSASDNHALSELRSAYEDLTF